MNSQDNNSGIWWQRKSLGPFTLPARNGRPSQPLLPTNLARILFIALLLIAGAGLAQAQDETRRLNDFLDRAKQLEASRDYSGAEAVYLEAEKALPQSLEIQKRLGIVYQTEVKFPESVETFRRVLLVDPRYPEVNFYLGLSYFGLNQYDLAIGSFETELVSNPTYKRARYYEAQVDQSIGRESDAYRQYEIILQQDPQDQKVLYQLVRFLKAETLRAVDQLGTIDPNSPFMLVFKAESNTEAQDYTKAIDEYEQVLGKDPDFPGIHFALGEVYYGKVDFPNAEKELRLALKEDPNHPKANYYLADILIKAGKLDEAVPLLELSVPSDPTFMKGYFLLGKCYAGQGRLEDARRLLEKAEDMDPDDKNVHYQLAQLYTKMNQPDRSQQEMQMFQKLYTEERARRAENMDATQKRMAATTGR